MRKREKSHTLTNTNKQPIGRGKGVSKIGEQASKAACHGASVGGSGDE